jgi:hypothetical protein
VLERIELLAPMLMASQSRWLSVALLISAGSYQRKRGEEAAFSTAP